MTEPTAAAPAAATETTTTETAAASQGGSAASGAAQTTAAAATTEQTTTATQQDYDWRGAIAGEDKDYRKQLERYTDPTAFGKAHRALQQKLSSGEYKAAPPPFPDKGTPEQQAEWRKAQGIPNDPNEYKIELPDGLVLGETDKPGAERLTAFAHKNNWSNAQLNAVLSAYYNEADAVRAAREEHDTQYHQESDDALRSEWKGDYRGNLQAIHNMLDAAPKEVKDRLLSGRTADGRKIADDPAILKWLASQAREINPAASLLPAGSQNMQGVGTRLDALRKMVSDRSSDYYKGPNAAKLQDEFRTLLDAEAKMKSRAA